MDGRAFLRLFLFVCFVVAPNVFTMLRSRRERKKGDLSEFSHVLIVICMIMDSLIVGLGVLVTIIFERRWYMLLCVILGGVLLLWLLFMLLAHRFGKKSLLIWLCCALPVLGVLVGVPLYDGYLDRITLAEEFDYRTYEPFRADSLVKTPEEPASLRFDADDALPRMDGATALYPVYAAFCQAVYPESLGEMDRSEYRRVITCSTTSGAYKAIVEGERDIIFVAGPSEEQEAYAAERGVELVYTPIGREAFVFFVHPKNPVDGLSLDQIREVYSGKITQWEELGASRLGKILAYQRDEGSGSQTALRRFVMGDTPLMAAEQEEVLDGMGDIVKQVSAYQNHRNALGYSFRFYCTALMKGFDVKLLEINGVAPTAENIENGSYPLASSFYAVTRSDADENTRALLDWITGPQGQALVERTGYTPVN